MKQFKIDLNRLEISELRQGWDECNRDVWIFRTRIDNDGDWSSISKKAAINFFQRNLDVYDIKIGEKYSVNEQVFIRKEIYL